MDLTSPARSVVPSLDADVLVALAGITMPMTGRQISRLIEAKGHSSVGRVLERLRIQGIVNVVNAGNAYLYTLNREHVAFPAIEALMDLRGKLFDRMAQAVTLWEILPLSVAIFGSAARGDGDVDSDIDILIVRAEELHPNGLENANKNSRLSQERYSDMWDSQLLELSELTYRWSGNRASLIQATKSQLGAMVTRGEPIADSLRNEAHYIWGQNAMKMIDGVA